MDELEKELARYLSNIAHNDEDSDGYIPYSAKQAAETIRKMIEQAVRFPLQNT